MGLIPESVYNVGAPVFVSQRTVFRIDYPGKNTSGAFLNTPETTEAGIQIFRFTHGAHVMVVILENSKNAFFLDALFATAGTVFPKLDGGILADGMLPRVGGVNGYMILLWHLTLRFELTFI